MRARAHDSARGTNKADFYVRGMHVRQWARQRVEKAIRASRTVFMISCESFLPVLHDPCMHVYPMFVRVVVCVSPGRGNISVHSKRVLFTGEWPSSRDGRQRHSALRDRLCDGVYLHLRGRLVATCLSPRGLSTAARAVRQRIKATRKEAGGASDARGGQKDRQEGQEAHNA